MLKSVPDKMERFPLNEVVIGSRNRAKVREVVELLSAIPVPLKDLRQYPHAPVVEEDGRTFGENAIKKATELARALGRWVLADDSGLEVDALGGAPGVRSARYAGEDATDESNNAKLLDALKAVPFKERRARFRCVAALASPTGELYLCEGTCEGFISDQPRGENGFGYDPVFFSSELGKTFGEVTAEVKHRYSHRGKAMRQMKQLILGLLS